MKKFKITGIKDVYCLFCGKEVGYDIDNGWEQYCEHLVFYEKNNEGYEVCEIHNLSDGFVEDGDETWWEFVERKLDDSYLTIKTVGFSFDNFFVFNHE